MLPLQLNKLNLAHEVLQVHKLKKNIIKLNKLKIKLFKIKVLESMIPLRIFNIHGTFSLHKSL